MSVLKFRKDPLSIDGVSTYNFKEEHNSRNLVEHLQHIISDIKVVEKQNVHVFYNVKDALLIPSEFMHEDTYPAQLNLLYGLAPGANTLYDEITIDSGIGRQDKMFCV